MSIRPLLAAAVALGAAAVTGVSAASSDLPYLRSASASKGHVIVVYRLGELLPGRIVVAVRPRTNARGALLKTNRRIDEPLRGTKIASGLRARTRHTLAPGRYYVQVSGTVVGLDCLPKKPCPPRWSNVRRVVVP